MKFPIIVATPRKDIGFGWQYYCKYCKTIHRHGKGLGMRVSHCNNKDSPNYGKDIIIAAKGVVINA